MEPRVLALSPAWAAEAARERRRRAGPRACGAAPGLQTAGGGLAHGGGGSGSGFRAFWETRRPRAAGRVGRAWLLGARPRQRLCSAGAAGRLWGNV
ncbi:bolA-like protein 3 isoform X2 [Sus scrofa]|uniref:bolA-like protein 3 isoform X2 n=1 Tax=Sus scrofa TaxID=9823 RepID=UPI000A2B049B|nr:bolA-like protein 3 isoform X2 [Sus scrofa]